MQKVIRAKGLVDIKKGTVIQNAFLILEGEKITAVGSQKEMPPLQGNPELLDLSDRYILPGLINSHGHAVLPADGSTTETWAKQSNEIFLLTAVRNARIALMSGVTTLRDCGARDGLMFGLRQGIDMGIVEGPRLFLSGRMLTMTGGHGYDFNCEVDGPSAITKATRQLLKEGADFIKVMATGGGTVGTNPASASFDVEEMRAAVQVAHRAGKKVAAHARGLAGMENAVEAGVDHLEHASFMLTDMTHRFDPKFAEKMVKLGIYVTPTLQLGRDAVEVLTRKKEEGRVSRAEQNKLDEWLHGKLEESFICFRGVFEAGVQCVAGDDAGCRWTRFDHFWEELDAMVFGGMKPIQALTAATKTASEAMGWDKQIGSLEPGKQADIIAVKDDPTVNISALSKVSFVMKAGKVYLQTK